MGVLFVGFAPDVDAILERAPKDRVTLMFSATFPPDIQLLARRFLRDYVFIATGTVGGACEDVKQEIIKTEGRADKKETLERLLRERAEKNNGKVGFLFANLVSLAVVILIRGKVRMARELPPAGVVCHHLVLRQSRCKAG